MDDSSKKIVMIIAGAALATLAIMAFNYYNQPTAEATEAAVAPDSAPPEAVQVTELPPVQSPAPTNTGPTVADIQAINGAPSMILDNDDGNQNDQGNNDAPAPAENVR